MGVLDRLVLADDQWERMAPLIIGRPDQKGSTGRDNRMFVEGVLWLVRTGSPWRDLPEKVRNAVLFGSGDTPVTMKYDDGVRAHTITRPFEGVVPNMERRFAETDSAWLKEELGRFQNTRDCESCHGKRLKPEALAVKIGGLDISAVADFSIADAARWFAELADHLTRDLRSAHVCVPPTVIAAIRTVGVPTLTGTDWPSLPHVQIPSDSS